MGNFDFLKKESKFNTFSDIAISAEKILNIDKEASILNCRKAMEFAVKWMYSVDRDLEKPYQDTLVTLMNTNEFKDIVDDSILKRMDYIRKIGNIAAHSNKKITKEQAELCLENLWWFLDYVAYCYSDKYEETSFDYNLLDQVEEENESENLPDIDLDTLIEENKNLRQQLSLFRESKQDSYVAHPLDISEYKTRKIYIDTMLTDVGWINHKDWIDELEVEGMPNTTGLGYVDYTLFGSDGRPIALIEAKKTCVDVSKGREQAKLYADALERKYGRRPIIFLSNGFEHRIIDGQYQERPVAAFYSKRDLEKLFNLRIMKSKLDNIQVNENIAGRYYQIEAIKRVCESFDAENRRKALLVMATGSGKTRTVIGLVDVLLKRGWIKNVLFLADRKQLVRQAKRAFVNLLPNITTVNLVEDKDNYDAHCVFSTYPTIMNCIDEVHDNEGKLYTSGHFDLIICDEAHRSIYNKYQEIFNYFDAPLVGLTATPKDEIDKNTYEIFDLEAGVPTYGYELGQAVSDHYLVPYVSVEAPLKFVTEGITYADLTPEEQAEYEGTFADEDGYLPEEIDSAALNTWIFNKDTIDNALSLLWEKGIRVDHGENLGKTIIFAKNHKHAEFILERFNKQYQNLVGYAEVIDNHIKYADSLIEKFYDANKLPRIAISVDMLDTGIDVPEILNLVFFKRVMSKAKMWQMIGRGTRLCEGLLDGNDKEEFYIFDLCGNFEFFRLGNGKEIPNTLPLQGALFLVKARICSKLQSLEYQTDFLKAHRQRLVEENIEKIKDLNRDNFAVRQHLKYVDIYSNSESYQTISFEDTLVMQEELVRLIQPDEDDPKAMRFDYLIYSIEYALLASQNSRRQKSDVRRKAIALSEIGTIPEVVKQKELIESIVHNNFLDEAGIEDLENIRICLRNLIKYIEKKGVNYETNFTDEFTSIEIKYAEINDELIDYKKAVEYYLRAHEDNETIFKIKNNIPIDKKDMKELERLLWEEIGTKEDYDKKYSSIPLGEFVRSITGLNMNAAKEAFAEYINDNCLNSKQIYFVNQVIEYFVQNGVMLDLKVLMDTPFTDNGSLSDIFEDPNVWTGLRSIINGINANAVVAY
ncbi:MAG: DEAD/DEAH box helicase family protein [Solobacterium sp.]|nr:DEAD/DEAH box helicase family protein [Solobacterium sp.]